MRLEIAKLPFQNGTRESLKALVELEGDVGPIEAHLEPSTGVLRGGQPSIPSSFAAVPPSIAARSASLNPGVARM